jgi:hypothetical protein
MLANGLIVPTDFYKGKFASLGTFHPLAKKTAILHRLS